ncbi:MAG: DUF1622 domain-containing protein [Candidatus Aminicenantes bacterium]|nr:DUF1622 domain-containing protein [Candidatus Aminicenantes bacterium]
MRVLNIISQVIGLTGAAVIIWGFLLVLYRFLRLEWIRIRGQKIGLRREALRHVLGSYLLLGLEILIAADIIRTITHPTLMDMAILAGIVVIRTIISVFLDKELAASHALDECLSKEEKSASPPGRS